MSSKPIVDGITVSVLGGALLRLHPPADAAREAEGELPNVDVSGLPGAWIAAREGYRSGELTLRVMCAAAPASGWAPGLEELVLGRATQIARGALGGEVVRLDTQEAAPDGLRIAQRFEGTLRRSGEAFAVRGRHWLGFAGDPRVAVLCTTACTEPEPAHTCEASIGSASAEGVWHEAPAPSLLVRSILMTAERPAAALAVLAAVALGLSALVIARRPRRPQA